MLENSFKDFRDKERCGIIRRIGGPSRRGMASAGTQRDVFKGELDAYRLLTLPSPEPAFCQGLDKCGTYSGNGNPKGPAQVNSDK